MLLNSQFDVAHMLGHAALSHLASAEGIHRELARDGLLDPAAHSWQECAAIGQRVHESRRLELEECIQAVILFQAMMEKVPYFIPMIGPSLESPRQHGFAHSWADVLLQIRDPASRTAAEAEFAAYDSCIYKEVRNPIVHGKKPADLQKVNAIRVQTVHGGMRQGWRAFDYLIAEAFGPSQPHQPSWSVACAMHGLPDHLDRAIYRDLAALETQFHRRHLDGIRP